MYLHSESQNRLLYAEKTTLYVSEMMAVQGPISTTTEGKEQSNLPEKQSNKERIKEITAGIEKGIMELFESDRYRNYLTTMSRFHR